MTSSSSHRVGAGVSQTATASAEAIRRDRGPAPWRRPGPSGGPPDSRSGAQGLPSAAEPSRRGATGLRTRSSCDQAGEATEPPCPRRRPRRPVRSRRRTAVRSARAAAPPDRASKKLPLPTRQAPQAERPATRLPRPAGLSKPLANAMGLSWPRPVPVADARLDQTPETQLDRAPEARSNQPPEARECPPSGARWRRLRSRRRPALGAGLARPDADEFPAQLRRTSAGPLPGRELR
jgi:hypothetical protein